MKTIVSLSDRVFREAERHARRAGKSRSQLYADALAEYLVRHAPDAVTEAMNQVCESMDVKHAPFTRAAGRRLLKKERW